MPTIVRTSNNPYAWEIGSAPLSEVANIEEKMPDHYISEDGFGITQECREYLSPLIQGEDYPPYEKGLPAYRVLDKKKVAKKLPPFEIR